MIGSMQIEVKIISKIGARINADVTVTHSISAGERTVYDFPLTITTGLQHTWSIEDDKIEDEIKLLVAEIYDGSMGIRWSAPQYGYWFDRHNSGTTVRETVNKMRNEGRKWFLQNPAEEDQASGTFGGAILTEIEKADERIAQITAQHLLYKPDRALERSQAAYDLSTPPVNDQDFINKVAILGILIDNFSIRRAGEAKGTGSLDALTNWITDKLGQDEAQRLTEPFMHIRSLRNQYPIHDRYERVSNGHVVERSRIQTAAQFFGFLDPDDCTAKWKKVCDKFKQAVQELEVAILT